MESNHPSHWQLIYSQPCYHLQYIFPRFRVGACGRIRTCVLVLSNKPLSRGPRYSLFGTQAYALFAKLSSSIGHNSFGYPNLQEIVSQYILAPSSYDSFLLIGQDLQFPGRKSSGTFIVISSFTLFIVAPKIKLRVFSTAADFHAWIFSFPSVATRGHRLSNPSALSRFSSDYRKPCRGLCFYRRCSNPRRVLRCVAN